MIHQVINVAQTTIVQAAWERGQELFLHGTGPAGLSDGLVRELGISISSAEELTVAQQTDWETKSASLNKAS